MGAGIAQLGVEAGCATLIHDPFADVPKVIAGIAARWEKKGVAHSPPVVATEISALSTCDLIVEAVPERFDLKQETLARLSAVAPEAVLCSNTSSIPITALAAAAADPSRVVGMHFFNPPAVMRLVEVVSAVQSDPEALDRVCRLAEAMGKHVIRCKDVAGFVVNRANRSFGLEALRCLQEGVAGVETIDRIYRLEGGFRMGPFELQDLVGIDTGYEISLSFHQLSFGEPRWRPSTLSAQMTAAGRHGRKTGRGWYRYDAGRPHRSDDQPEPPVVAGMQVEGSGPVAEALRGRAANSDFNDGPRVVVDGLGGMIGTEPFYAITPLHLVEVTGPAGEAAFSSLGLHTARVSTSPAGVLPRAVCRLVNEAYFMLGEQIASPEDIDAGLILGLNHPRGAVGRGDLLGRQNVLTALDGLRELHGDAYRAAPLLRRLTAAPS
jgi:3-hydroxybutyryl-CoA dehydrogenase